MLPFNYINVYCHKCGKICSSFIKSKPHIECRKLIKEWLECPYCVECIIKGMKEKI